MLYELYTLEAGKFKLRKRTMNRNEARRLYATYEQAVEQLTLKIFQNGYLCTEESEWNYVRGFSCAHCEQLIHQTQTPLPVVQRLYLETKELYCSLSCFEKVASK